MSRKIKKKQTAVLIFLLTIFALSAAAAFESFTPRYLQVHFLDVGQGDAILIETPSNRRILVDGGPDAEVVARLGEILPFYDRRIDIVVLTHADTDHVGGLAGVLSSYKVGQIFTSGDVGTSAAWLRFGDAAQKELIPMYAIYAGYRITLDQDVVMDVLHPTPDYTAKKDNDASVVMRLRYKDDSFLLTGDIERSIENLLVGENFILDADVLKVAHHGSQTSTSYHFFEGVSPQLAIIQSGAGNPYGHPHSSVLERLAGTMLLRTDMHGTITLRSDGDSF